MVREFLLSNLSTIKGGMNAILENILIFSYEFFLRKLK